MELTYVSLFLLYNLFLLAILVGCTTITANSCITPPMKFSWLLLLILVECKAISINFEFSNFSRSTEARPHSQTLRRKECAADYVLPTTTSYVRLNHQSHPSGSWLLLTHFWASAGTFLDLLVFAFWPAFWRLLLVRASRGFSHASTMGHTRSDHVTKRQMHL